MTAPRAVVRLDHERAEIHSLDPQEPTTQRLRAHHHETGQHHSGVRDAHEFFAAVCDAIDGCGEVLVVGGRQATADFGHYLRKHRPATAPRVVECQVADHATPGELVAHAREFFERRARLGGVFKAAH